MRRILHSLLIAVSIMASAIPASAGGQATDPPPARPIDLATVTLTPSDLEALGLTGYGLANQSSLRNAETDALVQADGDAVAAAERLAVYREAGLGGRYVGSLLTPRVPLVRRRSGLIDADARITTSVTRFSTPESAAAAFAYDEDMRDDAPGFDMPGSRPFGDQSEITRSTGIEQLSGEPFQRLELSFQSGAFVGEVTIVDYRNVEPDVETAERLADALLAKLDRVRAAGHQGIGMRTLRLFPSDQWIEAGRLRDFYVRKDGQSEPTFAEIVSAVEAGIATPTVEQEPRPGTVLPIDTYLYWTPVGDGDPRDLPLYVAWLDHYASPEQATAALNSITDDLGPGYFDVEEFPSAETIGEQSREWVYAYDDTISGSVRGALVVTRVGSDLVRLQVDGPTGVRGAGVRALAQAQADCLVLDEDFCPPIEMLDALAELAPPANP